MREWLARSPPGAHTPPFTCTARLINASKTDKKSPPGMVAGCRDVGPASCDFGNPELIVSREAPVSHTPPEAPPAPDTSPVLPGSAHDPLVLPQDGALEQCHVPTAAASVTDDLQHLRRIHDLLPGFASSFASCHFSSINLLPVRKGNRTDPWGDDGGRQERELNQVRTSSASPPHWQQSCPFPTWCQSSASQRRNNS